MMPPEKWWPGQSFMSPLLRAGPDFQYLAVVNMHVKGLLFPIRSRCLFLRLSTAVSCCFRSPIVERWLSTKISHMSS
ncbi:hypothetical protein QVD17_34882 [Tagetes erecta]|uniref:Uncharacterized protein n=1 Tax=Tagetes erecta TaxID=13708 RepID=A0AAD8NEQ2_TARER|nr:hypothetical protein QVD17_34882 [Tagetes erecta]